MYIDIHIYMYVYIIYIDTGKRLRVRCADELSHFWNHLCMNVCIHIYYLCITYLCIRICIYACCYIYLYVCIYIDTGKRLRIRCAVEPSHFWNHLCMNVRICVYICVHVHIYTCIYVYWYTYLYVCKYNVYVDTGKRLRVQCAVEPSHFWNHLCMKICICISICMHMHMCIDLHIYMCVCI